ncbi:DUF6308 family protein [Winogradskya humida]|nr:DUF6308 family protein [Actinoplanes humidus]
MLLAVDAPRVLGDPVKPRLRFVEQTTSEGAWAGRRLLTLDDVPAFELSFWCGTCQFLFERLPGATTTVSPGDAIGPAALDDEVISRFASLLPEATYQPLLIQVEPRLVHPARQGDYFAEEQVATWGLESFWGLPVYPRTPYYRTYETPVDAAAHLYEFVVPMVPPSWNNGDQVLSYATELTGGAALTAVAVSVLDICAPAVEQGPDYYTTLGPDPFSSRRTPQNAGSRRCRTPPATAVPARRRRGPGNPGTGRPPVDIARRRTGDPVPPQSLVTRRVGHMPYQLTEIVRGEGALEDVRAYFHEARPRLFTGRRFEALAGGGDRPGTRDIITADDIVAVQMLSVSVPAEVSIDLLDGRLGRAMSDLLPEIPTGVELGAAEARKLVEDGGPADRAWHLLKSQTDVGYVTAGKLMARKRPHLIPVYDDVVSCLFGRPDHVWLRLHDLLAADDGELHKELTHVRGRAGLSANVGLIRVLDVVLWMSHHQLHRSGRDCAGFGTVATAV